MRVNGPYIHTTGRLQGRKYVNIVEDNGRKTSMLYSRWLMQTYLGRKLSPDEHVDHIDEDFTNDSLSNLQILSKRENSRKSAKLRRRVTYVEFICPNCGKVGRKDKRQVDHNRKQGKAGPYCSRSCAGKAHN